MKTRLSEWIENNMSLIGAIWATLLLIILGIAVYNQYLPK